MERMRQMITVKELKELSRFVYLYFYVYAHFHLYSTSIQVPQ